MYGETSAPPTRTLEAIKHNSPSTFAELSMPWTNVAPQTRHLQRCLPADVLPCLLVMPPQWGHLTLPIGPPASVAADTGN